MTYRHACRYAYTCPANLTSFARGETTMRRQRPERAGSGRLLWRVHMKMIWMLAAAATLAACHRGEDDMGAAPDRGDTTAVTTGADTSTVTNQPADTTMAPTTPSDTSMVPTTPTDTSMTPSNPSDSTAQP